jgi:putative transposase
LFFSSLDFAAESAKLRQRKNQKQNRKSGVEPPHSKIVALGKVVEGTYFRCSVLYPVSGLPMLPDSAALRVQLVRQVLDLPVDELLKLQQWLNSEPDESSLEESTAKSTTRESVVEPSQLEQKCWPHAPSHRVSDHGTFLVTAATLGKQHLFRSEDRLTLLEEKLLLLAREYGWDLEAWAVFSNHYHFVGHSSSESESLKVFLSHLHSVTASTINQHDGESGRQVWHNFRDTQLTFEKSYFARLNYVHQNAVRHGLVTVACQYRWCSASWFERTATPAQVATIYSFRTDRVKVDDDFEFDEL